MSDNSNHLYRSRTDRRLAGVIGGIAERYDKDPSILRMIYAIGTFFTACIPGTAFYILMAIIIPRRPKAGGEPAG